MIYRKIRFLCLSAAVTALCAVPSWAAPLAAEIGNAVSGSTSPARISSTLQIMLLLTVLSLAPSILVMMTSFTRIIVILSFLRQAMSLQNMPPNQVVIGIALFLTFFVMAPTWNQVNATALKPYMAGEISSAAAYERGIAPVRQFMLRQTRKKDLALFIHLAKLNKPKSVREVPTYVIIPAFIISELKTAFEIGFMLFIPFMVIDMIVASVLMAMGMMMIPPMIFSLPFKVLLFVLVDGWYLLMRGIVLSFH